ncbi:hypothetical protein QA802_29755 [Streptomyces sp. B21-105]|uniref:hypothetical protein n=1 Tax=Streptomyces sp. B21-105 TaxID=3039417 RepID=UPI002FF15995
MRRTSTAVTAALACLVLGAVVAGCTLDDAAERGSAEQMLDDANDAMRALKSVTIDSVTTMPSGDDYSSRLTTDLKSNCSFRTTSVTGARLEQIRIGETDYVRPDRAYLEESGRTMTGVKEQNRWIKTPVSAAHPGGGLATCTWQFTSFGVAVKGASTKVDGRRAFSLTVTDTAGTAGKAGKEGAGGKQGTGGTYTFYVATEGKPYILRVIYKGADHHSTTTFSAFDEPLNVRPPAQADVVDMNGIGR